MGAADRRGAIAAGACVAVALLLALVRGHAPPALFAAALIAITVAATRFLVRGIATAVGTLDPARERFSDRLVLGVGSLLVIATVLAIASDVRPAIRLSGTLDFWMVSFLGVVQALLLRTRRTTK